MRRHSVQRLTIVSSLVAGFLMAPDPSLAQQYPAQTIRFIVPQPPAGLVDTGARILAQEMTAQGTSTVVENRPGATGVIGAQSVVNAAPDGYTICVCGPSPLIRSGLVDPAPYDSLKDLAPVSSIFTSQSVLVARKGLNAKDFGQLVELAKSQPGKLTYGTPGLGSQVHLGMALLTQNLGISMVHIPFGGEAAAIAELLGERIDVALITNTAALGIAQQVQLLGAMGKRRSNEFPDLATLGELGVKDYSYEIWVGLQAPAKTPAPVLKNLHQIVSKALASPALQERYKTLGISPLGSTPEEYGAFLREQLPALFAIGRKVLAEVPQTK